MIDPRRLLDRIPRLENDRPLRYLGRRVVQAMAEAASANLVLGQRTAPGRYLVLRLVEDDEARERWEQQFAESKAAIIRELEREAEAREIRPRGRLDVELRLLTDAEADSGVVEDLLAEALKADEIADARGRLREERELVLPRRIRALLLESDPSGAQAYVDHEPVGVTPCRIEEITEGEHTLTFSQRGYLLFEERLRVDPRRKGQSTFRAVLAPEPEMGVLEVRTFPPEARVTVGGETRVTPARWRLPSGPVEVRIEKPEFEPQVVRTLLPGTPEDRPHTLQARLEYCGPFRDEVVGRLIVYRPQSHAPPPRGRAPEPPANRISEFFRDAGVDEPDAGRPPEPAVSEVGRPGPPPDAGEVLGERPLRRGVLLIGRVDPGSNLVPDVKLFDPENTVTRGCHAWLYVYADVSTGASYNTFLIGNNSPSGVRVDGELVMGTRRLSEDAEIEIGGFRMRVVKELPEARVEF